MIEPPLVEVRPNAFSPIQALPPEVLSEILTSVPNSSCLAEAGLEYKSEFQILSEDSHSYSLGSELGQVCHSWRNVSLSTPALWSYLLLEICDAPYPARTFDRLQAHLERSKSFPLTITLNLVYLNDQSFGEFMESSEGIHIGDNPLSWNLLQLVLSHGSRVRALYLNSRETGERCFGFYTIPHIGSRFTNLEHIILSFDSSTPVGGDPDYIPEALSELPLLRRYDRYGICEQSRFPNTNLTHITLLSVGISHFYSVLRKLPYLKSADVDLFDDCKRPNNIAIPSSLGFKSLDVSFSGPSCDAYTSLINLLNCPFLTTLSLDKRRPTYHLWGIEPNPLYEKRSPRGLETWILAFSSFLTRSPNIESLHIQGRPFKDSDVIGFLRNTPRLVTLELVNEEITKELLLEMGSEDLVPNLRHLLVETHPKRFHWVACGEMLQQRKGCGLLSAHVTLRSEMAPVCYIGLLQRLQFEGLAVRVVYQPSTVYWPSPRGVNEVELLGYRIQS